MDPEFGNKEGWRSGKIRKKRVDAMNAIEQSDFRRNARERQRKYREKKKWDLYHQGKSVSSTSSTPPSSLYATKQSFGKSIMRVKRSLSKSPGKK